MSTFDNLNDILDLEGALIDLAIRVQSGEVLTSDEEQDMLELVMAYLTIGLVGQGLDPELAVDTVCSIAYDLDADEGKDVNISISWDGESQLSVTLGTLKATNNIIKENS